MSQESSLPTRASPAPLRLTRLARRRLTRVHLALQQRPEAAVQGRRMLEEVARTLSAHLEAPLEAEAWVLDAVLPAASAQVGTAFVLLPLSSASGVALLEVELPFLVALLEQMAGGPGRWTPATRLTRIEEATFGYVLLVALEAARQGGGLPASLGARLGGMTLDRDEALRRLDARSPHLGIEVALRAGALRGTVRLLLPAGALRAPLEALAVAPEGTPAPELLAASVPARCLLGRVPVSLVELMGVEPGDVVTFAGLRRGAGGLLGPGRLLAPHFELRGELTPDGFTLTGAHVRAHGPESAMSPSVPEKNEQTRLSPSLPVEVEVELARVPLPLSELARLGPGSVLPLHLHGAEPVLLRVGDRVVARAELVDIEGEVGARILALLP